jgi:Leucine-rich repeat (LRR) protein
MGLSGPIPAAIYDLETLEELHLGENALTGEIPAAIANLANLQVLLLYANDLQGDIPPEIGSIAPLRALGLQANALTGSIPPELGNLSNLYDLDLSGNELTGPLPPQLGALSQLEFVFLYSNQLEGRIPSELGELSKLRYFSLSDNRFSGPIPESFRGLTTLEQLNLSGNTLDGSIPSWIGELTQLTTLALDVNEFTGQIPASITNLSKLTYLGVGENQLTGPLPDFSRMTDLLYLRASYNRLSGPIPASIGALTNLLELYLNDNAFTGQLPREFGNLTNADFLALSNNSIEGSIPPEVGKLKKAYLLSLWGNRFSGTIPREIGDMSGLQFLELSFNALRGPIPREITKLTNLDDQRSDFAFNALFTSDPDVRAFVNRKHYDGAFEGTQTVTPTNVRLGQMTDRSATLSWTPILYNYDGGGYQVTATKSQGTGAPVIATTNSKEEDSITVRNLEAGTPYTFRVAAVTHPTQYQENLLVSDPSPAVSGTTGARIIAPPEVVVTDQPQGMVQVDGVEVVGDSFTLTNFGDLPATIRFELGGDFFTVQPAEFTLNGLASRVVTLRSIARPPGTHYGHVLVRGEGVGESVFASVVLLSVSRPAGSVVAEPISTTIELAGAAGSEQVGIAQFRNSGTARLTGIVVSDQPWIVPDPQPINIEPGTIGSVGFRVVRSRRPAGSSGALIANLSLVYVDGGSFIRGGVGTLQVPTGGVTVSKVTIIDTTRPPVAPGSIPGISAGELPLFIAGIANLGNLRSDLSLINAAGGSVIRDLKLYFTTGSTTNIASLPNLGASEAVSLLNIASNVYGASDVVGTLQIRTLDWESMTAESKITAVTPDGTFSGSTPVFRGDRSAQPSQRTYLAGVAQGADLFVQETAGAPTTVTIDFLNAGGGTVSTRVEPVAPFALLELRAAVPAGAATAVITNAGPSGYVSAYARMADPSGDTWSVVDWSRFYRYTGSEAVRIPLADGRGGGGKRRAVRSDAVTPRNSTDLVLFNPGVDDVGARIQVIDADGTVHERGVDVAGRATVTVRDVASGSSSPTAHVVVIPEEGALAVTARSARTSVGSAIPVLSATAGLRLGQSQVFSDLEDSAGGTVAAATPATFRTSYGLVETTGAPVTVRARIVISETNALVSATTSRTFPLGPRQQVFLPELLRSFAGDARDTTFGDLHNLVLELEVIEGSGSVVPFVVVTDNGTGDSIVRVQ